MATENEIARESTGTKPDDEHIKTLSPRALSDEMKAKYETESRSEELGRWFTKQLSLLLVNIWQFPCAFAPNYATLVVCRLLGGLSTGGGSVTLGVLADMREREDQEDAIALLVLSSVGGSVVGTVVGGFVQGCSPSQLWLGWLL